MAVLALPAKWGKVFRLWNAVWSAGVSDVYSVQADRTALGADFEVVAMHYQQLGGTAAARSTAVGDIHSGASGAGHGCVICTYVNGTYAATGKNPDSGAYRTMAYLSSYDASYPYLVDSGDTWFMDPTLRDWQAVSPTSNRSVPDEANYRRSTVFSTTEADGVMVDSIGWGITASGYNDRATGANPPAHGAALSPVNAQTGNTWNTDRATWMQYMKALPAMISGAYGRVGSDPISLYCNGAASGSKWFDATGPTSVLSQTSMACMFESWLREATDAQADWTTEARFVSDTNAIVDCQNRGRAALCWTKVWDSAGHTHTANSADDDSDNANMVAWHRFSLGAFLLASNGRSFYHFRHDNTSPHERIPKDRWWTAANNIGWPSESFVSSPTATTGGITDVPCKRTGGETGLYRREFSGGVVYVNPTAGAVTGTFPVAGTYADVDSTSYVNSASIPAHSARILVKQ